LTEVELQERGTGTDVIIEPVHNVLHDSKRWEAVNLIEVLVCNFSGEMFSDTVVAQKVLGDIDLCVRD
jgi:hypothetical protein